MVLRNASWEWHRFTVQLKSVHPFSMGIPNFLIAKFVILYIRGALAFRPFVLALALSPSPAVPSLRVRALRLIDAMASSSSDWRSETERRLQDVRDPDIDGNGLDRWRKAAEILKDFDDVPPSVERSQFILNKIRKDLGSKKLIFDPHRFTFVVEGRPVQVDVLYRLLQGSGGTIERSRSPSPALTGFFFLVVAVLFLKSRDLLGTFFWNINPLATSGAYSSHGCSGFGAHPRGRHLDGAAALHGRAMRPGPGHRVLRSRGEARSALPHRRVCLQLVEGTFLNALQTFTTIPPQNVCGISPPGFFLYCFVF